jgi:hypothetical protein
MANSDFTDFVIPGGANGGNGQMVDAISTDVLPWAWSPELTFAHLVTWKDLKTSTAVAQSDTLLVGGTLVFGDYTVTLTDARTGVAIGSVTHTVHEDTITIAGTASDGNYDTVFDQLDPPVRVRTVRSTTPATNDNIATQHAADITDLIATSLNGIVASASANANVVTIVYEDGIDPQGLTCTETTATGTITPSVSATAATVAVALEALLETARATTFAAYLEDESVDTATITLDYVDGVQVTLSASFPGTATATITITDVATLPIGKTGDLFPANVYVDGCVVNRITAFAGGTPTITAVVGDAGATNGLFTSTSIATTGAAQTIAATEFAEHFEAAFDPIITITSNRLFSALSAGELEVLIPYSAPPTI